MGKGCEQTPALLQHLTAGLGCSHSLSSQKLICICRSGGERIRTDKYPRKFDLQGMNLSFYISGVHSESRGIREKIFLDSFKPTNVFGFFFFLIWKNKGSTLRGAQHQLLILPETNLPTTKTPWVNPGKCHVISQLHIGRQRDRLRVLQGVSIQQLQESHLIFQKFYC